MLSSPEIRSDPLKVLNGEKPFIKMSVIKDYSV
jgi:hypothetical protein